MAKRVMIIGGGPAGLMAAAHLLAAGDVEVTIFERMPTAARKFLMAGRGGLNLTHSEPLEKFLTRYGAAQAFLAPYIQSYTPDDLRAWCAALGQDTYVGSSGRVFPRAMKASPLLRAWLARLQDAGAKIVYNAQWQGWAEGQSLQPVVNGVAQPAPDAMLLALGGASWPKLGSDGTWADILRARGVDVKPWRPANCGFTTAWSPLFRTKFAGQPLKPVTLHVGGQDGEHAVQGEIMITQTGIEGGAVYALSSLIRTQIEQHGKTTVTLDLKPDLTREDIQARLKKPRGRDTLSNHIRKTLGLSPVAIGLVNEVLHQRKGIDPAALMKTLPLTLTGAAGLARAISSAGGIARDEITPQFMLKKIPGVFVAGEMLDWEAPTGGYLLQATLSTAVAAANGMRAFLSAGSRT